MTSPLITGTYLDRILTNTRAELEERKQASPERELRKLAEAQTPACSMFDALKYGPIGVIAEIKRASPSKGVIAEDINVEEVADAYIQGGCSAISVLTDATFFGGSLADLQTVAARAHPVTDPIPVLRKDFVVDAYQVFEARASGADCILLIVAALRDRELAELFSIATELGMAALIEVHNPEELQRALEISPNIVGVNNRNLKTFDVDLNVTMALAPQIPDHIAIVGESGVRDREDVVRLATAGVDAVLVGESLMRQPDRSSAVRDLLN